MGGCGFGLRGYMLEFTIVEWLHNALLLWKSFG